MFLLIKYALWIICYALLHLIFSVGTLMSLFCFMIVIIINSVLLAHLHNEYMTYLILLLYLGGILIFFLFVTVVLSDEYKSLKYHYEFTFQGTLFFVLMFKFFFYITTVHDNIFLHKDNFLVRYIPSYVENNYFLNDLINNHGDAFSIIGLFSDKSFLLFVLGLILLFTMMAIIVITKNKNV